MMALQGIKGGIPITAIGNIFGNFYPSGYIYAGSTTPEGATKTYQWSCCSTAGGSYTNIGGATNYYYYVDVPYIGYYFKVTVTGTGLYSGSVTSAASTVIDGTLYYNNYVSGNYQYQGSCTSSYPTCQAGNFYGFNIPANTYQCYGSVANATAYAQTQCDIAGQDNANNGSCGNYYDAAPSCWSGGISSSDATCYWSPTASSCCNYYLVVNGIDPNENLWNGWLPPSTTYYYVYGIDVIGHGGVYWYILVASVNGGAWGPQSNYVYCYY